MADIEAKITFLKAEEGGRATPVYTGYRPAHLVKEDYLTTGTHHYYDKDKVEIGETVLGTITFINTRSVNKIIEGFINIRRISSFSKLLNICALAPL